MGRGGWHGQCLGDGLFQSCGVDWFDEVECEAGRVAHLHIRVHPVAGERVKLVVVPRDPELGEAEILAYCRRNLVAYKVPRVVEFRQEELPKSVVGKVLRRELR